MTNGYDNIDECDLNPGDHIYVYKAMFVYSHHVIVAGKKSGVCQIIHFTGVEKKSKSTARIRMTSLEEFKQGCKLRLYRYDHPLSYCKNKRRGTCCPAPSDPVEVVLRRARTYREYDAVPYF
ncbi:uncharacterized protein LOC102804462 [Saccoglossus kowalevskii]|uniref:Uncharacterized protein LOC102804462 n=1 Tax=Saccoglossus kowalevskii TaxID=10224 RepID=A0ABM0LYH4_SACKO|nr:PREDICTED: uncharacterized protein LOC102804462 [Saccoglossus kowalevskii]